jgi:uncharacterized membrane protein
MYTTKKKTIFPQAAFKRTLGVCAALVLALAAQTAGAQQIVDRDIVIPIKEIGTTAKFYPAIIDGTRLEVFAVKAPDATIRTAFNTCQVCYSSGRGYYKQIGSVMVCQNCGNRFPLHRIEVQSGGCNPVPIFPANKKITDTTITIPLDFLRKAKLIFANWRNS